MNNVFLFDKISRGGEDSNVVIMEPEKDQAGLRAHFSEILPQLKTGYEGFEAMGTEATDDFRFWCTALIHIRTCEENCPTELLYSFMAVHCEFLYQKGVYFKELKNLEKTRQKYIDTVLKRSQTD